jgi:UDP-N-acetylglucosamine--N-acetylmuramyl-(pentapeptide) pyrophosphoryl-undecaprenol N-acetylglucosamine transferase
MKILFTGGGTGGHFYPIIAVAEEIRKITTEQKMLSPNLYYMSTESTDEAMLFDNKVTFINIPSGKMRIYFSIKNITDIFKTIMGVLKALWKMYSIYPDVVFSKGGYASFPAVFSAWILGIPIIIHESDSVPGRANLWAGKHADRIAVSYPETARFFPEKKVAWTGQPLRKGIKKRPKDEAFNFLKLEPNLPVMLILGGSQGSQTINDLILSALPSLLEKWQIIHQTGKNNLNEVMRITKVAVKDEKLLNRYRVFDYLPDSALSMAVGASTLVVSRAGSTIFEIASWGLPSIVIPITESNGDHQRQNALNYLKSGATIVIEEANLSNDIFITETNRLLNNPKLMESMAKSAQAFARLDSANVIAEALINVCLEHEK